MGCGAAFTKKLLIICNFIVWLGGAGLLGMGLWMRLDPTIVHYLHLVNMGQEEPLIDHAGLIFIIVGGMAFFVGLIGCFAAIRESQSALFLYAALLVVIMLAEITGGIMALVYRGQLLGSFHIEMMKQVKGMYSAPPFVRTTVAWDHLQETMPCCGGANYTDFENSVWWNYTRNATMKENVPASCCVKGGNITQCQLDAAPDNTRTGPSEDLHNEGCIRAMGMWVHNHSMIMTILGLAISACQVFAFIAACCLRRALKNKPYDV